MKAVSIAPPSPLTLHLPFWLADRRLSLERLLAKRAEPSWRKNYRLLEVFALSGPEQRFAETLLARKRNLWLFRCNQKGFCGDFVTVDMSAADPSLRRAVVIELKTGAELKFGGGGAGIQFLNTPRALAEIAATGVVAPDSPHTLLCGEADAVLAWLGAG